MHSKLNKQKSKPLKSQSAINELFTKYQNLKNLKVFIAKTAVFCLFDLEIIQIIIIFALRKQLKLHV